jgi:hypothetical protein
MALSDKGPNKSYHLHDILPGGEKNLKEKKYRDGLSGGQQSAMSLLISPNSAATYNIIEAVVWKGEETVFGKMVCFYIEG